MMERVVNRNLNPGEFDLVSCEFLHEPRARYDSGGVT